jgi:hypothetical protein
MKTSICTNGFSIFISSLLLIFLYSTMSCDGSKSDKENNGNSSRIIDHTCTNISYIPESSINNAKTSLHIAYEHTSHGSQIISGMDALADYPVFSTKYQWSDDGSVGLDLDDHAIQGWYDLSQGDVLDGNGDLPWVVLTRTFLDNTANNHINVIMWSWCSINGHNIDYYITNMEKLIAEYGVGGSKPRAASHPVEFVFMTGHSEATGENGYEAQAAAKIRTHCVTNNRWLIDYYDIECYDPNGNYYGNKNIDDDLGYTGGNWAVEYIASHNGSFLDILTMGNGAGYNGCTSCAHSEVGDGTRQSTLNCVLKGQAAWWLWARLAGWSGEN